MKTPKEIEQLAEQWYNNEIVFKDRFASPYWLRIGYENGYAQCQEDMADRKYAREDLMNAFNAGINNDYGNGPSFDQWLNSLNNKQD